MSNSEPSSPAQTPESESTPPPTFKEKVNTLVGSMTKDDKGVLQFPEGEYSEELQFAAMSEKRRRDTHSSYTRSRQELAQTTTERDALKTKLANSVSLNLTSDQAEELETLKYSNPDAWKDKLQGYEEQAQETLAQDLQSVSTDAHKSSEVVRRQQVLESFTEQNPGFSLIDDDVPPRLSKRLESGEVSFEDFLGEVYTYLQTPKKVLTTPNEAEPNLTDSAGNAAPSAASIQKSVEKDYANTDIF